MKKKKFFIFFVSFISVLLLLNACTLEKTNDNLSIGLVQWIGYAPLYVAEHDKKLPQNLHLIDFSSNYDIIEALKERRIDGVVTFEPLKHKLHATGLHTVFSSRDIPNKIANVLFVTETAFKNNRKTLIKTLQALFDATKKIQKDRNTDAIVAEYLQTTPDALKNGYDGIALLSKETNLHLLSGENPALLKTIKHIKRFHKIDKCLTIINVII